MSETTNDEAELTGVDELAKRSGTAAKLFDVRTVIGGLFLFYGVLVGLSGVFVTDAELAKAQGVNINLWTGLAMLVVGGLFVLWLTLRPLKHDN